MFWGQTSHAHFLDSILKRKHFEFSIGQSLLFISHNQQTSIFKQSAIAVPTNAVLFFAEFRPGKKLRVPVFFNLPTETKQYLVNNQIVYQRASPTLGSGVEFSLFSFGVDSLSKIDFEIGPLASIIFNKNKQIRIAPLVAGRFRINRGKNFVMYVGASYSFGINALGILYGTGTIF